MTDDNNQLDADHKTVITVVAVIFSAIVFTIWTIVAGFNYREELRQQDFTADCLNAGGYVKTHEFGKGCYKQ